MEKAKEQGGVQQQARGERARGRVSSLRWSEGGRVFFLPFVIVVVVARRRGGHMQPQLRSLLVLFSVLFSSKSHLSGQITSRTRSRRREHDHSRRLSVRTRGEKKELSKKKRMVRFNNAARSSSNASFPSLSLHSLLSLSPLEVLHAGLLERELDVSVPARGEQRVAAVVRVQGDRGKVEAPDDFGCHRCCFLSFYGGEGRFFLFLVLGASEWGSRRESCRRLSAYFCARR